MQKGKVSKPCPLQTHPKPATHTYTHTMYYTTSGYVLTGGTAHVVQQTHQFFHQPEVDMHMLLLLPLLLLLLLLLLLM
jgi:hypothetical protein